MVQAGRASESGGMAMKLSFECPTKLLPHPAQEAIYGRMDGPHDAAIDELAARIKKTGIIQSVIVAKNTPGIPDGTIISGHRRVAAAVKLNWPEIPVLRKEYADAIDAKADLLCFNEQREKDEWIKTQEAAAWREIESARAKKRQQEHGGTTHGKKADVTGGTSSTSDPGKTRDAVAEKLHESGKTTELRFKLHDKAKEQSPEDPGASPIAKALAGGKAVKTVARAFDVGPKAKTKKAKVSEPSGKKQTHKKPKSRPADADDEWSAEIEIMQLAVSLSALRQGCPPDLYRDVITYLEHSLKFFKGDKK
jgi:ParB-like chromosome segregation protein Spo0J